MSATVATLADLGLTPADVFRMMAPEERLSLAPLLRDELKDKSYEMLPLGREVKRYLAARQKNCTASTLRTFEHVLVQLVKAYPTLELKDFELPVGADRLEDFMDERWGAGSRAAFNVNHSVISEFFK